MSETEELSKVKEDLQVLNAKFTHLLGMLQTYFTSEFELNNASMKKNEADQKHKEAMIAFTQNITLLLTVLTKRVVELEKKVHQP